MPRPVLPPIISIIIGVWNVFDSEAKRFGDPRATIHISGDIDPDVLQVVVSRRIESDLSRLLIEECVDGPDLSVHNSLGMRTVVEVFSLIVNSVVNLAEVSNKILVSAVRVSIVDFLSLVSIGIVPILELIFVLFVALDVNVNGVPIRNTFSIDEIEVFGAFADSFTDSILFSPRIFAGMASVAGVFAVDAVIEFFMVTSAIILTSC